MKISTKGRYAVRLMLDVAIHGMDKNVSMRDVAERQNISIKYLEQIVSILTRVGYLKSVRGAQGGYRLTKAPSEYTIGDILRTTEGTLSPVSCLEDEENTCPRVSVCPTIKLHRHPDHRAGGLQPVRRPEQQPDPPCPLRRRLPQEDRR